MWKEGVTVSINSDDAEMARRLNQEAGKTVKYGGVPEEEALKFVTLNPAKLLHLDDRMGSLKAGKDADIVLWTEHPLSIYAKVQKTFVDGICYFDATEDEKMRVKVQEERARIIQKMLQVKDSGGPMSTPSFKPRRHFHCDTMDQSSMGLFYRQ
jgi:adenine deaminase